MSDQSFRPSQSQDPESRPISPFVVGDESTITIDNDSVSTTRELPEGTKRYRGCCFDIDWNRIYLTSSQVHGAAYRLLDKSMLSRGARPSDIWMYGAAIQDDRGRQIWLCERCHLSKSRPDAYLSSGTTQIQKHLNREHNIEIGQYKQKGKRAIPTRPANPWAAAREFSSSMTPRKHFDELEYKTKYVDWVITQDMSFNQAVHSETRDILAYPDYEIQRLLPKSETTLSSWIKHAYELRHMDIKDILRYSRSKITISFDIWTSTNYLSLLGVVAHFLSKFTH